MKRHKHNRRPRHGEGAFYYHITANNSGFYLCCKDINEAFQTENNLIHVNEALPQFVGIFPNLGTFRLLPNALFSNNYPLLQCY